MAKSVHQDLRFAELDVVTGVARAHVVLDLDGGTKRDVETGHAVLDGWVADFAMEAGVDLGLSVEAEPSADAQDAAEAAGRALGLGLARALEGGDQHFGTGHAVVPKGDCLVLAAVDVEHGPMAVLDIPLQRESVGTMPTQGVSEFLRALAAGASATIHVRRLAGTNDAHTVEAMFRALGASVRSAVRRREEGLP